MSNNSGTQIRCKELKIEDEDIRTINTPKREWKSKFSVLCGIHYYQIPVEYDSRGKNENVWIDKTAWP